MTLLTTREALAEAVEVTIGLGVAPVHDCTLCARGWACPIHVGEAVADALLTSGILRDVSTLADDEALVDVVFDALDERHDHAHHVHAAECCWPFGGVTVALLLAASTLSAGISGWVMAWWVHGPEK